MGGKLTRALWFLRSGKYLEQTGSQSRKDQHFDSLCENQGRHFPMWSWQFEDSALLKLSNIKNERGLFCDKCLPIPLPIQPELDLLNTLAGRGYVCIGVDLSSLQPWFFRGDMLAFGRAIAFNLPSQLSKVSSQFLTIFEFCPPWKKPPPP